MATASCPGAVDECPDAAEVRRTLELLQHELRCMREQEATAGSGAPELPTVPTIPTIEETTTTLEDEGPAALLQTTVR